MLAKLYGLTCNEALKHTQAFHDARRYPQNVRSPQTAIQRTQVTFTDVWRFLLVCWSSADVWRHLLLF